MGKIYARTKGYDEPSDWEGYMEPYIEDGSIILEGEDARCSYNCEILFNIDRLFNEYETGGLQHCLESYLEKENGKKYSANELHLVKKALDLYGVLGVSWYIFQENLRVTILSIIKGKKYEARPIRGYCQGDYAMLYVAEDLPQEVTRDIEAIYFGTGTEIIIDDSDEEIVDPNEISGYHIYTSKYKEDDLKAEIADQVGCDVEDVVLWMHDGYTKVPKYKLAE